MAHITKVDRFIQSSPHPAWLATTQGHCVYANPALERLTGFNSDQINQADWRSFLLEQDRAAASASWQSSLACEPARDTEFQLRGTFAKKLKRRLGPLPEGNCASLLG